jgi:WD40 repeat protein
MRYWCFISYRHADNKELGRQWATWLHQAIETYEVPADLVGKTNERGEIIPGRIFPVFRDEDELPADADLASPIYHALEASQYLLVICSPRAVDSTYVANEIHYFKAYVHQDRVLAAIIDGEPNVSWDQGKQALGFAPGQECFPEPLRHRVDAEGNLTDERTEPIAADFRLDDATQGWTSPEAYRQALSAESSLTPAQKSAAVEAYRKKCELMKLKIIAGLLGVPLGDLTKRDAAYQLALAQKRARLRNAVLAVVSLLAIVATLAAWYAWVEKNKTEETLARSDFMQAAELSRADKSREALAYLARSLRLRREHNPASMLAFDLLMNQPVLDNYLTYNNAVRCVAYNHRESQLAVASWDKTASVWDVKTGTHAYPPLQHQGAVDYLEFSNDDSLLATAGRDKTARVWDAATGKPLSCLNHDQPVYKLHFSPDGKLLLTQAGSVARLWEARTGRLLFTWSHADTVMSSAFSPDGKLAATASDDKTIGVWDVATGTRRLTLHHDAQVRCVVFSPDGRHIASAGWDDTVRIWDASSGQPSLAPIHHPGVAFVAYNPAGDRLVTTSFYRTARVWSAATGQPVTPYFSHGDVIGSAVFSPDGGRVATSSWDGSVRVWSATTGEPVTAPMESNDMITSLCFTKNGSRIITGAQDGTVRLWNAVSGHSAALLLPHGSEVLFGSFSSNDDRIATGTEKGIVQVWKVSTGLPDGPQMVNPHTVQSVFFSPDDKNLLTNGWDGTARIWNTNDGSLRLSLQFHTRQVIFAAYSPGYRNG